MRPAAGSLPLFTTAYDFSRQLDRMIGVPIAVWSTKAFVGRWWTDAQGPIEADLSDEGKLVGTVTSHLDAPLDDCLLIYENWAYPLRQFKPGDRVNVDAQIDPQTIETYLRRVRVQGDRDVAPPYDRASFDIPRIIEIMSCHELAGGESYTFLTGAYQPYVDLSGAVRNGRAVSDRPPGPRCNRAGQRQAIAGRRPRPTLDLLSLRLPGERKPKKIAAFPT